MRSPFRSPLVHISSFRLDSSCRVWAVSVCLPTHQHHHPPLLPPPSLRPFIPVLPCCFSWQSVSPRLIPPLRVHPTSGWPATLLRPSLCVFMVCVSAASPSSVIWSRCCQSAPDRTRALCRLPHPSALSRLPSPEVHSNSTADSIRWRISLAWARVAVIFHRQHNQNLHFESRTCCC